MPTIKDLLDKIEEKCLCDLTGLPRKARIVWFPKMQAMDVSLLYPITPEAERTELLSNMHPTTWLRGGAVPYSPDMLIFEMFEDADEFRVYACPKADAKPRKGPDGRLAPISPTLYRLSKTSSVLSQDSVSYETLIDLVAEEWAQVDDGISTRDRERMMAIAYLDSLDDDYSVKQAARDLENEEHYEEDEEEEDDEDEDEEDPEEPTAAKPEGVVLQQSPSPGPPPPPPAPPTPTSAT